MLQSSIWEVLGISLMFDDIGLLFLLYAIVLSVLVFWSVFAISRSKRGSRAPVLDLLKTADESKSSDVEDEDSSVLDGWSDDEVRSEGQDASSGRSHDPVDVMKQIEVSLREDKLELKKRTKRFE